MPLSEGKSATFAPFYMHTNSPKMHNTHKNSKIRKALQNRAFRTKIKFADTEALVEVFFLVKFS